LEWSGSGPPVEEFAMNGRRPLLSVFVLLATLTGSTGVTAGEGTVAPELLRARTAAARQAYEHTLEEYTRGSGGGVDRLYLWSCRWLQAECALVEHSADQQAALASHHRRMKDLKKHVLRLVELGRVDRSELTGIDHYCKEADAWAAPASK
jgi:hypothetical protein